MKYQLETLANITMRINTGRNIRVSSRNVQFVQLQVEKSPTPERMLETAMC